jgi:hypothetical protein
MVANESGQERVARSSWDSWREEILALGVTNPLISFEPNSFGQIDLERSHPGGFSQFITGRQTLLSNLVRDPLAFSRALSAARRIKNKAERLSEHFGIDSLFVVGGLANFEADGFDLSLPILMWPVTITFRGDDYELEISGAPRVNPALVDALEVSYGIKLVESELLARQLESSDLVPVTVLNYLANLTADKGNLQIKRILVIGNFSTAPTDLLHDFDRHETPLLSKLSGEPQPLLQDLDIPELNLVTEADSVQMRIVARAISGQNFAVETLPGCGYTQTVVNVLAGFVGEGKRVLVVAPRRQTINELADRLALVGLPGLAIRSNSTWVDAISAISRNEKAQPQHLDEPRAERIKAENAIDEYFNALNQIDPELGVSVSEILRKLSEISALPKAPVTSARIAADKLLGHLDRAEAIALLSEAADLGEFRFGPQDTAWYQAQFESPDEVAQAISLAKSLRDESYPRLAGALAEFTSQVNFKPAESVEEWGVYLRLFTGIRETLDRFVNDVFDRPLTELIAATAPRKGVDRADRVQMSGGNRRRLKKLAKEYLRAGMHVADMHLALRDIQEQRELWQQYCTVPTPPQVPLGISEAQVAYQSFVADLQSLQRHLDPESTEPLLTRLSLTGLQKKLQSLAEDTEALSNLGDRALILNRIRLAGLGSLARDLAKQHTPKEAIALELELAWWQSALEQVLTRDGSVLQFSIEQLEENENLFRHASANQISVGAAAMAHSLSDRWRNALKSWPEEAKQLKAVLKSGASTLPELMAASPNILPLLAPVVMMSPYEVSRLAETSTFDAVLVLDAAGSTIAENLSAIKRAGQIIAFGDDAIAWPTGFEIECRATALGREFIVPSAFDEVRRIFGVEVLRRSYRTTSQALGSLINREFYQNRIEFVPSAAEYLGENNFVLDIVSSGNQAKTTFEGATESLDAELERTIELIFNHALWHPEQSLLVASASVVHAERIRSALVAGLQTRPNLNEFFESHGRERFEVFAIADLTHRMADRVIFSLGFGRTSHGAVLSNFGQLSEVEGRRHLANLLVSARTQITVVSCFGAEDVPIDRLANGALLLKDLLAAADAPASEPSEINDPMLSDLAIRLQKLGARVDGSYSTSLPLVVSYAKTAAVIEPDWSIPGANRTERFGIRPGLLRAKGWRYIRVYSFELFSDPQAIAIRVAESLGLQVSKRPTPLFEAADRAFEDTDAAWGERSDSNDQRLRQDKPPHWG